MRRIAFFATLLTAAIAFPLHAERGQSYFTANEPGTIVRQADDGKDIDVRLNMPVFPGDEVITSRRGRSEIRLSDGNIVALDRSTDVRFRSMLDAYDGDASQTVIELRYGHVAVQRTEYGREFVRLDTDGASYLAEAEAVYSVDSDRGQDNVTVFEGMVEVRTPQSTERVRAGESARIDQGVYSKVSQSDASADEFERWFIARAERNGNGSSRYLDRSLAYADYELEANGSWIYVAGYGGWAWRPRVAAGWRPYYYGEWMSGPSGCLVWVSSEPWGWVPYHYGRWAYDPGYGWVWLPGSGYAPAWVYWMYSDDYVGWAPAGWWDCYRPYYNWCYRPNSRASWDTPWWNSRLRTGDIDFRPWTFVQPNHIVGVRVDTAAVTTDLVRQRLLRGGDIGGGFATITNGPARFTRNELRDPASAINNIIRRGGAPGGGGMTDMTPFLRREPNVPASVRDRVSRIHPVDTPPQAVGGIAPIGTGSVAPIGGGLVTGGIRRGEGGQTPSNWRRDGGGETSSGGGSVDRGGSPRHDPGSVRRGDGGSGSDGRSNTPSWRDRVQRPSSPETQPPPAATQPRGDWRQRGVSGGGSSPSGSSHGSASDVSRRVIDRIGGPRVTPVENSGSSRQSSPPRESSPPPRATAPPPPPPAERSAPPPDRGSGSSERVHRGR